MYIPTSISAYRLNISATSDSSTPKKGGRGTKRKRVTLDVGESSSSQSGYEYESEAASKGAIEIHDTDHDGKFVKLFNTGEEVLYAFLVLVQC